MEHIRYEIKQSRFCQLNSVPISYWMSEKIFNVFKGKTIEYYAESCKGLDTCDNESYVRNWSEVLLGKIGFGIKDISETFEHKWYPYSKGGEYRKWYGNNEKIVLWENNGSVLRNLKDEKGKIKSRPQNTKFYFKEGLTFNGISSSYRAIRYMNNCIFGGGGNGLFSQNTNELLGLAALINSKVSYELFMYINCGLNFLVGDMLRIPFIDEARNNQNVIKYSSENINVSKQDWDSFETSWDFKKHPLI